ncbi:putative ATP-dependent DNA ligase [Hydrogenivirga caldilitoris]|uniref:Putative ATP-dependent DNA ligase n=1 Tax=Hydrogenivirga caldilitoris TaxID=246264 RepID=A0A497XQH9_9AQUI|nr:RNA ligase [Hydrogenivirga caldilitoris]RLJ71148.1 putative ATP-dependent DNA ligase [Hydrogenivirga caldilitoris]
MIDVSLVREAIKQRKARSESFLGFEYLRFSDDYKDIPRGTAVFQDTIIWGYPHIGRIFMLEKGLKEHFKNPFWVEEKVDGYNVRIFKVRDRVIALSRGGYLCPFTTDRVGDFIDLKFFEENPDLILCAEVAGPDNPYIEESPPFIREDIKFFVFDVMKKNQQTFLKQEEKLSLLERYSLPGVEVFGRFTSGDTEKLKELLLKLNKEKREGVVFKEDSEENRRAKYITSYANLNDIKVTTKNMLQLPPEYYTNRILRLVLFMEEEGINRTEHLYEELGRAFIDGLFDAIEQFKKEHKVYRTFRCKFRNKDNAVALMELLHRTSKHIQVIERELKQEGEFWVLTFDKVFLNMTGLLGHLLSGGLVFD